MDKKKNKITTITILVVYFVLLLIDLAANILAFYIPSLGAVAESINEVIIETISAVGVIILATLSLKG